jgi:SulP family sulfate permease
MSLLAKRRLPNWLQNELKPKMLLPGLTSGIVFGITEVIFAISLGSLVFSGALVSYLTYGIGMALVTAATMMIGTSLFSRVPGVIGSTQDSSSVVLAVIAAGLLSTLPVGSAENGLATVLVGIACATILTGTFLLALGYFKLGGLVRFIPYPVVGGFLAGTGWLLAQGSFNVMTPFSLSFANLTKLLQPVYLIAWVPGILFALILFFGMQRIHHYLALPAILVGAIGMFYLVLFVTHTSITQAIQQGLLLEKVSSEAAWQPLSLNNFLTADWASILRQSSNIAVLLVLSVVSLLLNASALELAIRRDVDLNRELRAAGFANILSGVAGGMVGYHALSLSTLSYKIGARGRLAGLVAGTICAVTLFAGSALLAYVPVPILGGLLFFLGLDFLVEWVIRGWSKLQSADYIVVLIILVVIATTNFLIGVGVGLVAAIILFVVNYSQVPVIHHALSGSEMSSNVERCAYHRRVLEDLGRQIYIMELQGFIFFGTANALLEEARAWVADNQHPQTHYILMDFRRVTGLDSSAMLSFDKARQLAEAQNITLLLTQLSENISQQFEKRGLFTDSERVRVFPDLDHGLEWCEEQLLDINRVTLMHTPATLRAQLADSGFDKAHTLRLMNFLERVTFEQGEILIRQGDDADRLYFIELGTVSVFLELENGERVRLQTLGLGTAVGEPGLYLGTPCTASVIADSPVTAYRLTRAALAEMKAKEPELAATFHEFAARLLSERLSATTRTLEAVLK